MPLKRGSSNKVKSENIAELHKGPRHAANVKKFGEAKANKIDEAVAYSKAHERSYK